jgi:4-amino-4-deoxy-L-arabinose transferase-like glycosyltransferase
MIPRPAFHTLAAPPSRPLAARAALVVLALLWLLPGLVGHDPWKGVEGVTLGAVHAILTGGSWQAPMVGGEIYLDAPPLFTLSAAASARLLGAWLPEHDAARLVTGVYMGLAVLFSGLAARRLFGPGRGWPAALFLLGSLGMLVRGHELAPDAAGLAALALGLYALARCKETFWWGGLLGLALGLTFLATGLPGALGLLLAALLLPLFTAWRGVLPAGALALAVAVPLIGAWALALESHQPGLAAQAWQAELGKFLPFAAQGAEYRPGYYLTLCLWFAFPAWPVAVWAVWITRRRHPAWPGLLPPAVFVLVMLALLSLSVDPHETHALPLLPGLAMLAAEGLFTLRRGGANAMSWFGALCFSAFALLFWIYWSALELDVPARLARHLEKLQPGYAENFDPLIAVLALAFTLAWIALLAWIKRMPERPIMVWSAGVTLAWCLFILFFLRVLDTRLSYRDMAHEIAGKTRDACIATRNLGRDQWALLDYHARLELRASSADCPWLLVRGRRDQFADPGPGWHEAWTGGRAGERRERFRLYELQGPGVRG